MGERRVTFLVLGVIEMPDFIIQRCYLQTSETRMHMLVILRFQEPEMAHSRWYAH